MNPLGLGTLVYSNGFTRDTVQECGEASFGIPHEGFPLKKKSMLLNVNKKYPFLR